MLHAGTKLIRADKERGVPEMFVVEGDTVKTENGEAAAAPGAIENPMEDAGGAGGAEEAQFGVMEHSQYG
jgi:hypothetical protein